MFRLLASALPADYVFPDDLEGLGYYINDQDEIRSIKNPKAYFHYFISKNERLNDMQREGVNTAARVIVKERLEALGMETVRLPLGAEATDRHLPIMVSSDLKSKKRVVVVFNEQHQDIGIFSYRIILGKGGINKGSAVDLVKYVQSQRTSPDDSNSPGIILANMGQLRWWRRGQKAITQTSWYMIPSKSSVDPEYHFDSERNTIPENLDTAQHVEYIFNRVITELVHPEAVLNIIGMSEGAVQVSAFLEKEENFAKWDARVSAFASLASYYLMNELRNEKFREWFIKKGRAYIISQEPPGNFLADFNGSEIIAAKGCPTFSLGEPHYPEHLLPKGYKIILDWFNEVNINLDYANPKFERPEFNVVQTEYEISDTNTSE